jgi:diguanylate cyclase (GGDEF)-like protein/PAS domain S-box-containing protein
MPSPAWSTQQLAEFLETISGLGDMATARRMALEGAVEALGAKLGAIVTDRGPEAAVGDYPDRLSRSALAAVREGRSRTIEVPGKGPCLALSVPIGGRIDGSLVVARAGQERFSGEERNVARGFAHALAMVEQLLTARDEERALREQGRKLARKREAAEASYRSVVERLPAIVYIAELGELGRWRFVSSQIEDILGFTQQEWTSDPELWFKQLHPDDRQQALSQENERVLGDRNPPPIDYRLLSREGKEVWVLDEAVLERDESGEPVWHGVLYDITERKQAELELERRAAQQMAVARLGERALRGAELQALMEDACAFVAASEGIEESCVWELEPETGALTLRASVGVMEGRRDATLTAGPDSPAGLAVASRRPVSVRDWSAEDRFAVPFHLRKLGVRSTVAVAIEGERQPLGALEAHSGRINAFSERDIHFAQSAANVLAHAKERLVAGEALRHGSLHDAITGLPNRPLFMESLEHAIRVGRGRKTPLAVFFCDLDHFKVINDGLGHEAGDEVLKTVGSRLRTQLHTVDTVARFGGDEFAILIEEVVDEVEAMRIAERICQAVAKPFHVQGSEQRLSASVGISVSAAAPASAESLLRDAHAAMYRAKDRGRNRSELFDEEMRAKSVRRLGLERELRRALDREELSLQYQPIISLTSGEIPALEALLRWQHPERGPIDPAEFIPVAEESGLIEPIGRWVIERACQQSLAWQQLRPDARPIDVTVNVSVRQFGQRDLPEVVAAILARTGLDPAHLKIEITESLLVEESGAADEMLRELNQLGVQLILDDFGTGYSSLAYLNRFPFDAIKIDRSFIEGLGIEPERSAIVEAIVGMARALGLRTIAEGVENEVQLAELRRLGCGYAQGFLFSGPLRVAEMSALLERTAAGSPFGLVPSPESSRAEAHW